MPVGAVIVRYEELREANRDDRMLEASITRLLSAVLAMAGRFDEAREWERRSTRVLEEAAIALGSRSIVADAREVAGDRAGAERELEAQWHYFRDALRGTGMPAHGLAMAAA